MIRRYKKGDARKVDVQEGQMHEVKVGIEFFDYIKAYTLIDNGKILGVLGFDVISNDEVQCFALLGKECGKKIVELIKFLKMKIPQEMNKLKLRRAIFTVKDDFLQAHRMARMLGFRVVKKLPLFFDGCDYQLYERVLENEC